MSSRLALCAAALASLAACGAPNSGGPKAGVPAQPALRATETPTPTTSSQPPRETAEPPKVAETRAPEREPSAPKSPATETSLGLLFEVWEVAEKLDQVRPIAPLEPPNQSRVIERAAVESIRSASGDAAQSFLARVTGVLHVERAGAWKFKLRVPASARLVIGGNLLVDPGATLQDGAFEVSCDALEAGEQPLDLAYLAWPSASGFALEALAPGATSFAALAPETLAHPGREPRSVAAGLKQVLYPLSRARPGSGLPRAALQPSCASSEVALEGLALRDAGLASLADGRVLLADGNALGSVWIIDPQSSDAHARPKRYASGLDHPSAVALVDARVFVLQRGELTELVDADRDGNVEDLVALSSAWSLQHGGAISLAYADRAFYVLVLGEAQAREVYRVALADGATTPVAKLDGVTRLVSMHSNLVLAFAPASDAASMARLFELGATPREIAWLPGAVGEPVEFGSGPFAGELCVGTLRPGGLVRVELESVDGRTQGACFDFATLGSARWSREGAASDGGLWLAGIRAPSSPGGAEAYELRALRCTTGSAFDLAAVHARSNGFDVEFTAPLAAGVGFERENWELEATDFAAQKRTPLEVLSSNVSDDRRHVFVEVAKLEPASLVRLRAVGPLVDEHGARLWTSEAWYSLDAIPVSAPGAVRAPVAAEHNRLNDDERAAGWRLLFDGATTRGWHEYGKSGEPIGWKVQDGVLARVADGGADLVTDEEYESFELSFEWKLAEGGNSGVLYHVADGYDYVWRTGPEFQLLDDARHPDGRNPLTSAGADYALYAPAFDDTAPVGLWNQARIRVDGAHVEHWLNGVEQCDYELWSADWKARVAASKFSSMPDYGRFHSGRIALQDHGDAVWFRDVKLRPIR